MDATDAQKRMQAVEGWWQKNVGPIDQSPAMQEMLAEFINGAGDGKSPLSGLFGADSTVANGKLGGWAGRNFGSDWKLPELGLGGNARVPNFDPGAVPSASNLNFSGGLGDSWAPVAMLGFAVTALLFYLRVLPLLKRHPASGRPTPVPGLGPWPIDPRRISDRDGLVKAFEYLSLLTLGNEARQYNHLTIASELRQRVPGAAHVAEELAGHYGVARYRPPAEPIAPETIRDARLALCRLAGVRP